MKRQVFGLILACCAILVAIVAISAKARVTTNLAGTEIHGIDVLGVTESSAEKRQIETAKVIPADVLATPVRWAPLTGDGSN